MRVTALIGSNSDYGLLLILVNSIALIVRHVSSATENGKDERWSYNEPSEWYKKNKECASTRQSPIALWKDDIKLDSSIPGLELHNYEIKLNNLKLENNGHTIKIEIPNSTLAISGGRLRAKYKFVQMHFHWGETDERGSEHMIGEKFYPAELHLVHIHEKMTLDQALKDPEGLAVLGVFYELNDVSNKTALMPIINNTERVVEAQSSVSMDDELTILDLLPLDTSNFYTYDGSLTTPPCNEVVIWTIFTHTFPITSAQLQRFRSIKIHEASENLNEVDIGQRMLFNHRLPQPLHGRSVFIRKNLILNLPTKATIRVRLSRSIVALTLLCTFKALTLL